MPVSTPTTCPGARLPHIWLDDGRPIPDELGREYSLLRIGRGREVAVDGLASAFAAVGAPFRVYDVAGVDAESVYGCELLLVRPDLHVAWRDGLPPQDPKTLAETVTGWSGHR